MTNLQAFPESYRIPVGVWAPRGATLVNLEAARGETVAFQVQVRSDTTRPFHIAATDFLCAGLELRGEWSWYHEMSIHADPVRPSAQGRLGPGWYFDPLVRPDDSLALSPGTFEALYVEYSVPEDAEPAEYAAQFLVAGASVYVVLTVQNWIMRPASIPFVAGLNCAKLDQAGEPWETHAGNYIRAAREHGISLVPRCWMFRPPYDGYDAAFGEFIPEAVRWLLPIPEWFGTPYQTPSEVPDLFAEVQRRWIANGWSLAHALAIVYDEPIRIGRYAWPSEGVDYYRAAKAAAPRVPIMVCERPVGDASTYCDILATRAGLWARQPGVDNWFYQDYERIPLNTIDATVPGLRAWPWIAKAAQADGCRLFSANFWSGTPWTNPDGLGYGDGNGVLFYPGVTPSLRLKAIRRGLQDLAILEGRWGTARFAAVTGASRGCLGIGTGMPPMDPNWWDSVVNRFRAENAGPW